MSKSKLFTEAIAEAKALKQTALQNAKLSLAETFQPKINTLISETLNEQEDLDETFSIEEDLDNLQESDDETLNEMEDEFQGGDESLEDTVEGDDLGMEDDLSLGNESDDLGQEEVGEISVDELKDVLRDVMAELDGETLEDNDFGDSTEDEFQEEGEEDLDLGIDEGSANIQDFGSSLSDDNNALLSAIKSVAKKSPDFLKKIGKIQQDLASGAGQALRSESAEIEELQEINKVLKDTLKEVNLINAKLLYSNKIFNSKNLTESQKLKVMKSFDEADNITEAKKIYSVIKESLSMNIKPKNLRENVSFASKPTGNSTRSKLNEGKTANDETVNRWQFLAGIKN